MRGTVAIGPLTSVGADISIGPDRFLRNQRGILIDKDGNCGGFGMKR